MDSFEVRLSFIKLLERLTASTTQASKAANFALKHAMHHDDLHSCILEQLQIPNSNYRANIMFFLPVLCDVTRAAGEVHFGRQIERDIVTIVGLVAPEDSKGAANVPIVRQVLQQLGERHHLNKQTVTEILDDMADREGGAVVQASPDAEETSPAAASNTARGPGILDAPPAPAPGGLAKPTSAPTTDEPAAVPPQDMHRGSTVSRQDKRQIDQRIEEDRERSKKSRETAWLVMQPNPDDLADDAQFEMMWERCGELEDEDYQFIVEEAMERIDCLTTEKMWIDRPWPVPKKT